MAKYVSYFEKLKDPRWQRKRLEVFEREDFTCEHCGTKSDTLHVHHGYYQSGYDPWDYDIETLHCLCEGCHSRADDVRRDVQFEVAKLRLESQEHLFHLILYFRDLSDVGQSVLVDNIDELAVDEIWRRTQVGLGLAVYHVEK